MKPQPLKDKYGILDGLVACYSHMIRHDDIKDIKKELNKRYYSEEDIISAVKWLKDRINGVEITDDSYDRVLFFINEAFEDVTGADP